MTCKEDGCELSHCKQCGQHFGYSSSHTCEDCEYDDIADRTEAQIRAFNGDINAAAKWFRW